MPHSPNDIQTSLELGERELKNILTSIGGFFGALKNHAQRRQHSNAIHLMTVERDVKYFSVIRSHGPIDLHISIGNEFKVLVTAEETILPHIETVVDQANGVLEIDLKRRVETCDVLMIQVTMPRIEAIASHGSGDIKVSHVSEDTLSIFNFGSGDISINGAAIHCTIKNLGSGDIFAEKLNAQILDLHLTASGDMEVRCLEQLTYNLSGSGDLRVFGNPKVKSGKLSGSGDYYGL